MNSLLKSRTTIVWLALMLATVITTWVLQKDAIAARVATVSVFLIAAYKVRLVLMHFMDLRIAPRPLRLVFDAWLLIVTAMVLLFYLRSGQPPSGPV